MVEKGNTPAPVSLQDSHGLNPTNSINDPRITGEIYSKSFSGLTRGQIEAMGGIVAGRMGKRGIVPVGPDGEDSVEVRIKPEASLPRRIAHRVRTLVRR